MQHNPNVTLIRSTKGWTALELQQLWKYRELVAFMVWRDIQGQYRQTALGMTWVLLRPMVRVGVFSVVFGGLLHVPSDGIPYPLFSLAALLPWTLFSSTVQRSAMSLVAQRGIISKVYFPRLLIPVVGAVSGLVELLGGAITFAALMLFFRTPARVELLLLPLIVVFAMIAGLALGLWLATLAVWYRDVGIGVGFLLQVLMYATPVIYPVSVIPDVYRFWYEINPITGVIQGFRWALLGTPSPSLVALGISSVVTLIAVITGAYIFQRTARTIVDIV